jgi:hypothetical protein
VNIGGALGRALDGPADGVTEAGGKVSTGLDSAGLLSVGFGQSWHAGGVRVINGSSGTQVLVVTTGAEDPGALVKVMTVTEGFGVSAGLDGSGVTTEVVTTSVVTPALV